jgi:branched-chain amino acid transport system ATP-binding protein
VSIEVRTGQIVALLGANGAGKTTLLRTLTGLHRPSSGRVLFAGEDITRLATEKVITRGLAHVPEGGGVIVELTVEENLRLGALWRSDRRDRTTFDEVMDLFPPLLERRNKTASTLSGGERQMLAMGRGRMANPQVLLLDEPSEGLAPLIVQELLGTLVSLRETGMTILLAEQNFSVAESMADRVALMERGEIALVDSLEAIAGDEQVKRRYLGVG